MSTDPFDKAKESLGEAWKVARSAAGEVKKELERSGLTKSLDDAGRELVRAASTVATQLGAELEELGREIRTKAEGTAPPAGAAHAPGPGHAPPPGPAAWGQPTPETPPNPAAPGPAWGAGAPPAGGTGAGYPVGEAYAPEPPAGAGPAAQPPEGGFRIAADDDRRS